MIGSGRPSSTHLFTRHRAPRCPRQARKTVPGIAAGIAVALAATACSSSGSPAPHSAARSPVSATHATPAYSAAASQSAAASLAPAAMSTLGAHSLPAQTSQTLPAFPAYYDAHKDVVIVSDAFPKPAAAIFHANYAPSLKAVSAATQPAWYIVRGQAAAGQITVLGSEPGESDYSPLWRTVFVHWKSGATPKVLTSDNMINALANKGQLKLTTTNQVVNATVTAVKATPETSSAPVSTLGAHSLPAQTRQTLPAFPAYYDAHKDMVVVSDAFPRPAARTFHANYAPSLSAVKPASQPLWYIVRGRAAPGQIVVLGSEPGESDYSPLWRTVFVHWKPNVRPKVLTSDNMILALAKRGQLTVTTTNLMVNATVVSKP